jgi:hypothetical protein
MNSLHPLTGCKRFEYLNFSRLISLPRTFHLQSALLVLEETTRSATADGMRGFHERFSGFVDIDGLFHNQHIEHEFELVFAGRFPVPAGRAIAEPEPAGAHKHR